MVQLNSLDRPATERWVTGATQNQLVKIAEKIDWPTEVIAKFPDRKKSTVYHKDIENTIIQLIKRRPCTLEDLSQTLGLHINEINKYLEVLLTTYQIESRRMERGIFFNIKEP